MHDLDLSSVGKTNQLYSDAEEILIRQSMSQKEDALARMKRDIAQVEADLIRYKIALSPQKHLPDEVLSHIFVIAAEEHGPVGFPIRKNKLPPQLVLSHVCSRWRMLALHTSVLWSFVQCDIRNVEHLHHGWLGRAKNFPMFFKLLLPEGCTYSGNDNEIPNKIHKLASSLKVKILHLDLTFGQFTELSKLPNTVLPDIEKLRIKLISKQVGETFTTVPPILTRLRSLEVHIVTNSLPPFPWSQLRYLSLPHLYGKRLIPIIDVLRQTPMLQELRFVVYCNLGPVKQVTMPGLQKITLKFEVDSDANVNKLLQIFTCPALMEFYLDIKPRCTSETYGIIKQQYNIKGLRILVFGGWCTLPVSSILKDAPMLRTLSLTETIMDYEAIAGISNASLGRNLRSLCINRPCHVSQVLNIVEARKRMADELIERGCNWREAIYILNDIFIFGTCSDHDSQRIDALEEAGIKFTVH
ncbi:hypothetical protein APHAL10511_005653 [Amanita phalloides]|nr:hypothetical protein APHAL10511_005653 [Amanita phalloides]